MKLHSFTSNEFVVGDDWTISLTFADDGGNAIDITGDTLYLTLKNSPSDSDDIAVLKVDTTSHTDPTNGLTSIEAARSLTAALAAKQYWYDISWKRSASDKVRTILGGWLKPRVEITMRDD